MNTNNLILVAVMMMLPLPVLAQVEMTIEPMERKIHVAEPVLYTIKVKNSSKNSVTGEFNLDGRFPSFRIRISDQGEEGELFHNDVMWSAEHDDGSVPVTTISPGQEVTQIHLIHFDARFQKRVFAELGDYDVAFDLAWDRRPDGGPVLSSKLAVTAKVTVVPWDPEKDKRQIEALAIWDNAEVATFVQNQGKKSAEAETRLRRLKDEFGDTLYGGLAIAALENEKEIAKKKEEERERIRRKIQQGVEEDEAWRKMVEDKIRESKLKEAEMQKDNGKSAQPPSTRP